ncbi:hemagglutinin, partial [Mycoplasmopsis synoviae]
LKDTLNADTDALNGDNPTTKNAYYNADTTRTLYWYGFKPKIVVSLLTTKAANQEYDASVRQGGVVFWKTRNGEILDVWFAANQDKFTLVADQLT